MEYGLLYAIATIIVGLVVAGIVNLVIRWLKKIAKTTKTHWDDIIITAFGPPVQIGIVALSIYIALKYFGIVPAQYEWIISDKVLNTIYIVIGTWIASSIVHDVIAIYGRALAEKSEGDWDDRLIDFSELAARYIIWFIGIMLILVNLEINITPFLAGAGIAGLALALAAQDLISNFFGGAVITMDKPFKTGDRIKVDAYTGDVVGVGTRSTRIKTLDNQIVTIPNNKITSNIVVNSAEPDQTLRITLPVSVAYGSDITRVKQILLEIAQDVIKNCNILIEEPAPKVFFLEFGDSSLKFVLYVWAKAYNLPDDVRDAINTRIAERFAREGIEFPFPQLEIHMKK